MTTDWGERGCAVVKESDAVTDSPQKKSVEEHFVIREGEVRYWPRKCTVTLT